jgi:methionyl-tRNA synthetase
MEYITIDDFAKVKIQTGLIVGAEIIEQSDKLLKLTVDFGEENTRQVLSGIRNLMPLDELVGRKYLFVTNLKPRMMLGMESQAMILGAGGDGEAFSLFSPINDDVVPGSTVR